MPSLKKTKPRVYSEHICFVIMPFGSPFDEYYQEIIAPSVVKAKLQPLRADEINRPGVIVSQIWKGIQESVLCIADVTGRNPNVMYELGLAHAIGRPVVQLAQGVDDIPFDLRSLRHIVYRTEHPNWKQNLADRLRPMLREATENPTSSLALDSGNQRIDISKITVPIRQTYKPSAPAHPRTEISELVYELENFHSNPEGVYYIGRSLVRTHSLLTDMSYNGDALRLTEELMEELDSDTRKDEGIFDPVISVGKVTHLIKCLKNLDKEKIIR